MLDQKPKIIPNFPELLRSFQIAEQNYSKDEVVLLGINNNGHQFSKLIQKQLKKITDTTVSIARIKLNPADPLSEDIVVDKDLGDLKSKVLIIVDDVANTGRTIFYAFQPLLALLPSKLQVAVLVDRKHKSFPIEVDYVGLSLATTMKENIVVKLTGDEGMEVHLN